MQDLEAFVGNLEVGELLERAGVDLEELARRLLEHRRDRVRPSHLPSALPLDPHALIAALRRIIPLSHTETAVAHLLLWGATDREIATQLGCSERTAKRHVAHLLAKAGAKNRASLMRVLFEATGVSEAAVHATVERLRNGRE